MDERGQTSLEYVLIVAGIILLVVVTTLIIRGQIITPLTNSTASNATTIKNLIKNVS